MNKFTGLVTLILLTGHLRAQTVSFDYKHDFKNILAQTNDATSGLYFNKLVKRFKANDSSLTDKEMLALLIGFTDDPHFKPYHYLNAEREIYSLNADDKFAQAITLADSLLANVPVSQQALVEKSYAYYKLSKADSADHYMWQFRKIMAAMASTGDGLSPETAIFSLGPTDGQNFIRKYLAGAIGMMGSGRDKHGNFIDILTAITKNETTGETISRPMYFSIQHAIDKMFEPGEPRDGKKKSKSKKG